MFSGVKCVFHRLKREKKIELKGRLGNIKSLKLKYPKKKKAMNKVHKKWI